MSQPFYKSKKKTKSCEKNSGKCGEITFCMQLGTRVYALNCLFCPQICIQWDAFISHMEEEHDEELRSDHLLQQEIGEVNVDVNNSKDFQTAPKQSSVQFLEELPQSSKMSIRTEFIDGTSIESLLDYNDPLGGNEAEKFNSIRPTVKAEHYDFATDQSFESPDVNAVTADQTYESIDEQMDSNSQFPESNQDDEQTTKIDVQAVMEKLNAIEKLNIRLLKEVKQIHSNSNNSNNNKTISTLPKQPFENKEDFLNFEGFIQSSEEQFSNLVTELRETVSGNSKQFVKGCWRKLMRDIIAQDFCWQGSPVKIALKAMSTTLAIKQAYSQKFAHHSDVEFEKCTIFLFQQAKNRLNKRMFKYDSQQPQQNTHLL